MKGNFEKAADVVYLPDGAVVEMRAFVNERGYQKVYSGWFNDRDKFIQSALELEAKGSEVYATLNPCPPDLLARRNNVARMTNAKETPSTSDKDILRRRWINIDCDPQRPSKISATNEEKERAFGKARQIRADLLEQGMPTILADSGNGAHVLVPVDLPNDDESTALVKGFLRALDAKYSDEHVHVDTGLENASRISKVYGTAAKKGDSVEEIGRVHRPSALLEVPESMEPVGKGLLQRVIDEAPVEPAKTSPAWNGNGRITPQEFGVSSEEWLDTWIEAHNVPVVSTGDWNGGGRKFVLESCPWNDHADGAAYITQQPTGAISAGCLHDSCRDKVWQDLRKHFEPSAYERKAVGGRSAPPDKDDNNDNDSRENLVELPEAAKFPVDALPPTTRQFVREAARSVGCPVDYVGASVLTALSAAIGDTRNIHIKADWKESATLYTMIIGRPTAKKSPAMKMALQPVWDRQKALRAEYEAKMAKYLEDHKAWKQEEKEGGATRSEPKKPVFGRSYADDTTVERLGDILKENPRGILITKDELSGWLRAMDQYKGGKGNDRQFWLSAHNNLPVAIDRKNMEHPTILSHPFVSILGGIQPDVLPDFGKDRGDGLIERFLPVYPEPMRVRWTDDEVSAESRQAYDSTVNNLYSLTHLYSVNGDTEERSPATLRMTPEAKALWVGAYNASHDEAEAPGFPQRLGAVWGKLEAYTARLALILAMTRVIEIRAKGGFAVEQVESSDIKGAIRLIAYFKSHVRRTYTGLYGENTSDRLAADLKDFLEDQGGSWEGVMADLYNELPSDYKPERDKEFGKLVRAICRRTPTLRLEDLKRTAHSRPFIISLESSSSSSSLSQASAAPEGRVEEYIHPDPNYGSCIHAEMICDRCEVMWVEQTKVPRSEAELATFEASKALTSSPLSDDEWTEETWMERFRAHYKEKHGVEPPAEEVEHALDLYWKFA